MDTHLEGSSVSARWKLGDYHFITGICTTGLQTHVYNCHALFQPRNSTRPVTVPVSHFRLAVDANCQNWYYTLWAMQQFHCLQLQNFCFSVYSAGTFIPVSASVKGFWEQSLPIASIKTLFALCILNQLLGTATFETLFWPHQPR